jgi:hypothetical protein
VAVLAQRAVVAIAPERTPTELAVASAEEIDGPDQHRAAGRGDLLDRALGDPPIGVCVELEPLRFAAGLGNLLVGLRALVRLNLEDAFRARGSSRAALTLCVVRLEGGHRAQEEGRIPAPAEDSDRGVELLGVRADPARPELQPQVPHAVGHARLQIVDAHVQVGPMHREVAGVRHLFEIPHVQRVVW